MAEFNPQIPDLNPPNFFKYSEPVHQPKSDSSTGIALATLGEGIEGGAKMVDTYKKESIEKDIRSITDEERGKFTSSLETIKQNIPAAVQTSAGSTVGALGYAQEADASTDSNLPSAITGSIDKIGALKSALDNGKINDTYYTMQLDSRLQKLRSENPGYLDYIDQKVSQITGMNPANEYYKNLMQDINRATAGKDATKNATERMLRDALTSRVPNADVYLKGFREGTVTVDQAEQFVYRNRSVMDALKEKEALRQNSRGDKEDIKTERTGDFTNEVGAAVANNMKTMITIPGADTPQGILDTIKAIAAHPEQYTSAQIRTLDSQIMAQKTVVLDALAARASEMGVDKNGKRYSYNSDIGTDTVQTILKNQVAAAYDNIHAAFSEGGANGAGLAFWHARQIAGMQDDTRMGIYQGNAGQLIRTFKVLQEDLGPSLSGVIIPKVLGANIDDKIRGLFEKSATEARAQPQFTETGKPLTLLDHMTEANKLEQDQKINKGMKARYIDNLVNIVDDLKDPNINDKTKTKVVQYLFSPEGQGVLNNIKTDYTDPQTGKFVPGKYAVFTRLTAPDVVDSIAKLSRSDPTIGMKYKNYLENEAGSQLFYKELQNLNRYTGHDDLHFSYDSDNHMIKLINKDGSPVSVRPPTPGVYNTNAPSKDPEYLYRINEIVNRVNTGLAGLSRVEKGLGGDVNNYLIDFMQHAQVNFGQNWTGNSQKIIDAVAASRTPQRRIEDTFKSTR